jgi:glucose-6-phosphate isomerase
LKISLYHDTPDSTKFFETFRSGAVLARLQALDSRARRKGLDSLDPAKNPLIGIGMEIADGRVSKNSYGVFDLAWQAAQHSEWAEIVERELEEIRQRIKQTHGAPLKFLIWAGMGGSAEDKSVYNAAGLLNRGPRCYVLDSTDPAKLKFILEDMTRRSRLSLADALRRTLVVGMAMGMTSYEPVVNLRKLAALFEKYKIDSRPKFIYMTLPDSLLDQFGSARGYRKIELQLDNGNSTAGRHSAPMTRGSLYPLGLAGTDLRAWMSGAELADTDVETAWRLAAFLHAQGAAGRDKVTLMLPKEWAGAALWTKQDFEESLGKSAELGIKIVIDEPVKLTNYRAPKDPLQDRVFLCVQVQGLHGPDLQKTSLLRRRGYPTAVLTLPRGARLSSYMQFMHYAVFGVAFLRKMNFVTQPGVELYKAITNRLHSEAEKASGIENTREWQRFAGTERQAKWRGGVTLHYDRLPGDVDGATAPAIYAALLCRLAAARAVTYGELTFFGDMRYSPRGRAMRTVLHRAGETLFRSRLKMPVDVYEGPAMNHSYHEMIIGHGGCFSTVLLSEKAERLPAAGYTADYHKAQFLATQMALAERGRAVVAITVKDLEPATLAALDEFFRQAATQTKDCAARLTCYDSR